MFKTIKWFIIMIYIGFLLIPYTVYSLFYRGDIENSRFTNYMIMLADKAHIEVM